MASSTTLKVQVPAEARHFLERLAQQTGRDMSELLAEAVANYVALQESQIASIKEAIAEADAGAPRFSNDVVMAWLESWETPNELPPPA